MLLEKKYEILSHEDCQEKCESITRNNDKKSCIISYSKITNKEKKCLLTTTSNKPQNDNGHETCIDFTKLENFLDVIEDTICPCFTKRILKDFRSKQSQKGLICESSDKFAFIGVESMPPPTYSPTGHEPGSPTPSPTKSESGSERRKLLSYNSRRRTITNHDPYVMSYEAYVKDSSKNYKSNFCVKEGDISITIDKKQAKKCVAMIKSLKCEPLPNSI